MPKLVENLVVDQSEEEELEYHQVEPEEAPENQVASITRDLELLTK